MRGLWVLGKPERWLPSTGPIYMEKGKTGKTEKAGKWEKRKNGEKWKNWKNPFPIACIG